MKRKKKRFSLNRSQMNFKGFTLVELAIVLVIVGLLVGGVLQGQELVRQATIRVENPVILTT